MKKITKNMITSIISDIPLSAEKSEISDEQKFDALDELIKANQLRIAKNTEFINKINTASVAISEIQVEKDQ